MWRRRAHWVARKNGWVLTSEAPAREPRRRISSLIRSFRISDLQRLEELLAFSEISLSDVFRPTVIFEENLKFLGKVHHPEEYSQT